MFTYWRRTVSKYLFIKDGKESYSVPQQASYLSCTEGILCTNADSIDFKAPYKLMHFLKWAWKSYLCAVI